MIPLLGRIGIRKIDVAVKGVGIMKGTLKNCLVLYAEVQKDDQLDELGEQIICSLASHGLIHNFRPIKWHATLINTRYCTELRGGFDVTKIIKDYANFDFGKFTLSLLLLNSLQMPLDSNSGYYHSDYQWKI